MKSVMIAAALCAAFCLSAPASFAATAPTATKLTDHDLYCSWFYPLTSKCGPAKPVAAAAAKPAPVPVMASAKPMAPAKAAPVGIKVMSCVPASKGSAYLFACTWKAA